MLSLIDQRSSGVSDMRLSSGRQQLVLTSWSWLPHDSLFLVLKVVILHTEACAHLHCTTTFGCSMHGHTAAIQQLETLLSQVQSETVQLHLVAALQSLHREGQLLPATQREVLSAMLREHGASAILQTGDAQTPQHRRSFTGSSEGSVSGGHLMAGNQASPGIPRQPSNLTRRPSDLGQPISGQSDHFFPTFN